MVSPTTATFYFYKSFWSVLRSQALETKPPRPSPEPSPEPSPGPCWTWPGSAPTPPRPSPELSPEPHWTWPGACTSAHRSSSGLKTPLAYTVGEKMQNVCTQGFRIWCESRRDVWRAQELQNTFCMDAMVCSPVALSRNAEQLGFPCPVLHL